MPDHCLFMRENYPTALKLLSSVKLFLNFPKVKGTGVVIKLTDSTA